MKFSQRQGITPLPDALKPEGMPPELRNSLWNCLLPWLRRAPESEVLQAIWRDHWKAPIDTIPFKESYTGISFGEAWRMVRENFFKVPWHGVYDFLEFFIGMGFSGRQLGLAVDEILAKELAAYRVVNQRIVPVTNEQEIKALEEALSDRGAFALVATHLASALNHLSNRQNPDYRNSIKESISAVEAIAKVISRKEKAELGDALAALEQTGKLHGALRKGYTALYGYTSDASGIRHALMDESNLTADDAKYFLLACTAFVNYLKTLA
ncbi:hypothetical protein PQR34_35425 [Paraburkholderia sediminicola]|uniref:AbiJ-NTD4 domain-containing protein n=1 Tax=Paraburkholderia sediminicola TaxID=458836 RepID=UPI0038BDF334